MHRTCSASVLCGPTHVVLGTLLLTHTSYAEDAAVTCVLQEVLLHAGGTNREHTHILSLRSSAG
jgi:hypothetical protein